MLNGKNVLVTGGLGFLGSSLAVKLVEQGANVAIADALIPGLGGNEFNIHEVKDKVEVIKGNLCDEKVAEKAVKGKDMIFHLAGQVDHHRSMENPLEDLDIRCRATLTLLEAMRKHNKSAKTVYTSTRAVYGSPGKLPVSEEAPTNPVGVYAATSLAAEKFMQIYGNAYGIKYSILRLTNLYGPRQQMRKPFGVVNWFIRRLMDDSKIQVMGSGENKRDYLYVDDAVAALMAVAEGDKSVNQVFNAASGQGVNFVELAKAVIAANGSGSFEFVRYPEGVKKLEPGSFVADISKITSAVGWKPETSLLDGLAATIQFYRQNRKHYW